MRERIVTDAQWQHVRWLVRDDGSVAFEMRLGRRGFKLVSGALDAAHDELDRTRGPVPGGVNAPTPEAERRRQDALGLVIERFARAMELGFVAESRERARTTKPRSRRKT